MTKRRWITIVALVLSGLIAIAVAPKPIDGCYYSIKMQFLQDGTNYVEYSKGMIFRHDVFNGACTKTKIGTFEQTAGGYRMNVNGNITDFTFQFPWLWLNFPGLRLFKWPHSD